MKNHVLLPMVKSEYGAPKALMLLKKVKFLYFAKIMCVVINSSRNLYASSKKINH